MDKTMLIIYPHWAPSNLAGVHRARLIGNFLPLMGWKPVVVTVDEQYYEEPPDKDIYRTFRNHFEVHKCEARPVQKPRIIGDIGLRAFRRIFSKALTVIGQQKIDFIWIPIPSFYMALIGRLLHNKTNIPYGIDYIDPWVRDISNRKNFRAVLSLWLAKILEPYAVKKASLISGVSEAYYMPVIRRNFKNKPIKHVAMPYGFDPADHQIQIQGIKPPWFGLQNVRPWIYAGAFLPNSGLLLDKFFETISLFRKQQQWDSRIRLFFIGTGHYKHKSIAEYATDHHIADIVVEDRDRKPFLHVLNYLNNAEGVMIIGSTEPHYTASKTFQSLLSQQPVFAMIHAQSSASKIMHECLADNYLVKYNPTIDINNWADLHQKLKAFAETEKNWQPVLSKLHRFSAKESARKLVEKINEISTDRGND